MHETDYKIICGQLIGYYRQEYYHKTHDYQYTQRGMIEKSKDEKAFDHQKYLCSTTTLRHIEKGFCHRREELYEALAKKIHKSYFYSRRYHGILNKLYKDIYQSIESMKLDKMREVLEILSGLSFQNLLFYDEVRLILQDFLLFYLFQKLPDIETIKLYQAIYPFFSSCYQKLMLHLLCEYYRCIDFKPAFIQRFLKNFVWDKKDFLYIYTYVPFLISRQQHLFAQRLLRNLRQTDTFKQYPYMQFYYYHMQACILTNIDFEAANQYMEKCSVILNGKFEFAKHHHAAFYHNCGLRELFRHHYEKALDYFQKGISFHPLSIFRMLPYIYEASLFCNQSVLSTAIAMASMLKMPSGLYLDYYLYFSKRVILQLKDEVMVNYLKKMIIHKILPVLQIEGQQAYYSSYLYALFNRELQTLNQISHSLKK